jgi:hypothetical protein
MFKGRGDSGDSTGQVAEHDRGPVFIGLKEASVPRQDRSEIVGVS